MIFFLSKNCFYEVGNAHSTVDSNGTLDATPHFIYYRDIPWLLSWPPLSSPPWCKFVTITSVVFVDNSNSDKPQIDLLQVKHLKQIYIYINVYYKTCLN